MTLQDSSARSATWGVLLTAAAILMITMGTRQTTGLFLSPLNTSTGLGVATISFAMAIGQFVWGAAQPVSGALADRYGPVPVLVGGGLLLAAGTALTPSMSSEWGLIVTLGIMMAAGSGAGSFSILIGASAQQLPPQRRSFAAGFINAGGSFGQFLFAPLTERLIAFAGWANALIGLAVASLLTIPLALRLGRIGRRQRREADAAAAEAAAAAAGARASVSSGAAGAPGTTGTTGTAAVAPAGGMRAELRRAFADRSYLLLHAGFFTCGFHIAFLITHLPGEVALCGLPATVSGASIALIGLANIVGSLGVGKLGERFRMKHLLFCMYLSRAVIILVYMAAPKTPATFYLLAIALGLTWLATVPPTAGLVGKLFGVRYLSTLFGLTLLSHQVGGFLGAWLGGIAFERFGSYDTVWIADAVLATLAAVVNLPIREAAVVRPVAAAVRAG
ncbi:MAG: MFS transporter [Lautropia sp.]